MMSSSNRTMIYVIVKEALLKTTNFVVVTAALHHAGTVILKFMYEDLPEAGIKDRHK